MRRHTRRAVRQVIVGVEDLVRGGWMGLWMPVFCAIALSVWSDVATTRQTAVPAALSGTLRDHVKDERFEVVTSLRGLPLGVRGGRYAWARVVDRLEEAYREAISAGHRRLP